jgi:hypothetical protein
MSEMFKLICDKYKKAGYQAYPRSDTLPLTSLGAGEHDYKYNQQCYII